MSTEVKIKITDNCGLRAEIDELYDKTSQIDLAKWSLRMAKHILDTVGIEYHSIDEIVDGFK